MVVYADILIAVNFIVDYFLLLLTAKFTKASPPLWRQITASVCAAMSSLVIFLPKLHIIIELFMRTAICAVITFVCFGFVGIKPYLRRAAVFFAVTFGFAGGMLAVWYFIRPDGMVINNSAVYFDISPLFLIAFSVVGYFLSACLRTLLQKNAVEAKYCKVVLFAEEISVECDAIVDTGNSLQDLFGNGEVIVAEEKIIDSLFGKKLVTAEIKRRYRAVPCSGAMGTGLLDGYRCDKAYIICDGVKTELTKPIIAQSKESFGGDYQAIINPRSLQ